MSENTALWDKLGKTDPSHTKTFKRAGGFSGTAIKPMWSYKRMTEEFGSCGIGWGINEPSFQVVPGSDGEVLVYCTVSIWYSDGKPVFGVGGDKVVVKQANGLRSDDEAFKKAYTDAVTNALKMIGVGADVHMGMFDDSKYVNAVGQEFAQEAKKATKSPPVSNPEIDNLWAEINAISSKRGLESFWADNVKIINAFDNANKTMFIHKKDELKMKYSDAVSDIQDAFPGSVEFSERDALRNPLAVG